MEVISILEFIGTAAFAISGALLGIEKRLDLFGVIFMAITTAVGGGIFRDLIIGTIPPSAIKDPIFSIIAIVCAVITFMFYTHISKFKISMVLSDAIGLGVFTAVGSNAAVNNGVIGCFGIVTMGVLTGVGGGILRDMFIKQIPNVFKKEVYAVACVIGGLTFYFIYPYVSRIIAMYISSITTFCVRMIAVKYNINLPAGNNKFFIDKEMIDI